MRLLRKKVGLQLSVESCDLSLGETFVAQVKVGQPDEKTTAGRVELLYRNTYVSYVDFRTAAEDVTTDDVIVASQPLPVQGADEHRLSFTVPPDRLRRGVRRLAASGSGLPASRP